MESASTLGRGGAAKRLKGKELHATALKVAEVGPKKVSGGKLMEFGKQKT